MTNRQETECEEGSASAARSHSDKVLLNEAELAQRWGISPKTLRNSRVTGSPVPYIRIGRLIRYPIAAVIAYEQSRITFSTGR